MKQMLKKYVTGGILLALAAPAGAFADEQALQLKVDDLTKKVQKLEDLTRKVDRIEDRSLSKWLTIGGDYRFRFDSLRGETAAFVSPSRMFSWLGSNALVPVEGSHYGFPAGSIASGIVLTSAASQMQNITSYQQAAVMAPQFKAMIGGLAGEVGGNTIATAPNKNTQFAIPSYKPNNDSLYTNRLGIDLHAKATKDVTVNVRLVAYKTFGSQDDSAVTNGNSGPLFADRVGVFDGTLGHVPSSSLLDVDRAYATWSNIADQPVWISVGRRPATNGAPTNLRLNNERPGNGGTPALLVDYAFDGMTLGWAPDIDGLPGAYTKICYGRAFDSGFESPSNSLNDTDMLGIAVIPIDTDPLRVWLQWNRGINIFDFPTMKGTAFGNTAPSVNLGAIDWYGAGAMSTIKKVGPGKLNFFGDAAMSITHPNDNVSPNAGFEGLMTGQFFAPDPPSSKTGYAAYVGARYDFDPTLTKFGLEYNHGSKNWITFAPAADDMWTSKLGTRGDVYEAYLIQELNLKPVSSHLSKAFFRIGFQYYDFEYTGSNNWVGAPTKISSINPNDMMLLTPLKKAYDIYGTFEVKF